MNDNKSVYPGVWKVGEKWSAHLMINKERIELRTFKIEKHAAMAYLIAKAESKL